MGNRTSKESNCIFCNIAQKEQGSSKVLAENESLALFNDINPASKQHYLIIPKEHLVSPKTLDSEEHVELVNEMVKYGTDYLKEHGGDESDMKIGFHWPPFTTVNHLHLHVIYPFVGSNYELRSMSDLLLNACVFCQICNNNHRTVPFEENSKMVVFNNVTPAAKYHFLVAPKIHIDQTNLCTEEHIELIHDMVDFGRSCLLERGGDLEGSKIGFHKPVGTSVSHLHLHCIYPASEISTKYQMKQSEVFISPDTLIGNVKRKLRFQRDGNPK